MLPVQDHKKKMQENWKKSEIMAKDEDERS
jgi:hypothetical protein